MKKIIILLALSIILTGCSMDYTLDFDDEDIKEKIVIEFDEEIYEMVKDADNDGFYNEKDLVEQEIPALNNYKGHYQKNVENINEKIIVTLNYIYSYKNFANSYLINKCFENTTFVNEEDSYSFSLSGNFACFDGEIVTLKVSSKNKVLSNNADYYKNGYYVWSLKPEDLEYEVKFSISKIELASESNNFKIDAIKIVVIVLLVIGLGAYLFVKKKISHDTF